VTGLGVAIQQEMREPSEFVAEYDRISYETAHVLPFLIDIFASYPRDAQIGWFGLRRDLLAGFSIAWQSMGFSLPVLVAAGADWLGPDLPSFCVWMDGRQLERQSNAFVFDWGGPTSADDHGIDPGDDPARIFVARNFRRMARAESTHLRDPSALARRFVGVNAVLNRFESLICTHIGAARSPRATRIRQGYVLDGIRKQSLMPLLLVGSAGARKSDRICVLPGVLGFVTYGPYLALDAGHYLLSLTFTPVEPPSTNTSACPFVLEIFADPYVLHAEPVCETQIAGGTVAVLFEISDELIDAVPWLKVEFRLRSDGTRRAELIGVSLESAPAPDGVVSKGFDWLPLLTRGPAAQETTSTRSRIVALLGMLTLNGPPTMQLAVRARRRVEGYVVYGPYAALPPGLYETEFTFDFQGQRCQDDLAKAPITIEVAADVGKRVLADKGITPRRSGVFKYRLLFEIPALPAQPSQIEFRVWSDGSVPFDINAVYGKRIDGTANQDAGPTRHG
jgi:hypothetical protein